ncbi:hypothetical protein LTR70_000606 [Exophiala xenobiotica]|uniref:Uncharacterized protein n=1 Tax=Lithohypha guttulata TaxID=1690604 RepID=A0ABR0KIN6_9EURO|nr:hypothetical protein LTR24_002147 [Lithohypha guttulata]KAK5329457.1 hypothetical protein LTR70_000606 [Exophiala xenobiotica]
MLFLVPLLGLVTSVLATGYFTNPTDSSLTVKTGDTITISWTNITDYDILSLGYFSNSNQTITWLIGNSNSQPTSYRWTVDAVARGFDLTEGDIFAFYICKDYNFGDPFQSSSFKISDDSDSSSSTTAAASPTSSASDLSSTITPSNTPTGTGTAATASATGTSVGSSSSSSTDTAADSNNTVPSPSSGLSTGAKAGIAVGIIIGVLGFAAAAFMYIRQRKQEKKQRSTMMPGSAKNDSVEAPSETPASAHEKQQKHKYVPYSDVHEAPVNSQGDGRAELGPGMDGQRVVELPSTNER